jgi:PAS domain S-box-containing protein
MSTEPSVPTTSAAGGQVVAPPATVEEIDALRAIVQGTAQQTGEKFFQSLVEHLARAIGVSRTFVSEFQPCGKRVKTLAYWAVDRIVPNVEFDLAGTPCEEVLAGQFCHHPANVQRMFPDDSALAEMGIEGYLGVPLIDLDGTTLGHLAAFHDKPLPAEPRLLSIFRIFASRVAAEMSRLRMDQMLKASEQRYRDLFEQAPIAYVYEDTDTRFVSANQAAIKLLGLKPDEVVGTVGWSLVAKNEENQRQLKQAFEAIQQGKESSLLELELRRKDDGRPVWVQFWSRPEPDGKHTRTMIIDITERVLALREKARLLQQNAYLQEEIKSAINFEEIVGRSPSLAAVLEHVRAVAPTDASVLITGETGTGKELIARAIHSASRRRDKPLIKVNCAALPAGLVESELFGHEKGAFTGALARRVGRFELADGGTIFLDEIGELPLEMQSKLLRVLQEGEIDRIGAAAPVSVDVRVIAATNRDLARAAAEKTFREDLYYRLNVFPLHLPPLRERRTDIPLLATYFAARFAMQIGKAIDGLDPATLARLDSYLWPGNIRELENIVERAVILSRGRLLEVSAEMLPAVSLPATPRVGRGEAADLESVEREHILAVLKEAAWVIEGPRGAAQVLGLHPNTLRSRMKKLGIVRGAHE